MGVCDLDIKKKRKKKYIFDSEVVTAFCCSTRPDQQQKVAEELACNCQKSYDLASREFRSQHRSLTLQAEQKE